MSAGEEDDDVGHGVDGQDHHSQDQREGDEDVYTVESACRERGEPRQKCPAAPGPIHCGGAFGIPFFSFFSCHGLSSCLSMGSCCVVYCIGIVIFLYCQL